MTALKPEGLATIQGRFVKRGCTYHAVEEFAERYKGTPIDIIPRLQMALEFARIGLGKERPARRGLAQDPGDNFPMGRRIFDVELSADDYNPQPYMIRILTSPEVDCVITVLPLEFRSDIHAKEKIRDMRVIDEDIATDEPETEKVVLPPPVEVRSSLADKLRTALSK